MMIVVPCIGAMLLVLREVVLQRRYLVEIQCNNVATYEGRQVESYLGDAEEVCDPRLVVDSR